MCNTDLSHHQCGGGCAVWINHICTDKGVQCRTTKTDQRLLVVVFEKMIFQRQSSYNLDFILLWLYPDVPEIPLAC